MVQTVHIVGRGIAGLSLAFELTVRGRSVVLHGPADAPGAATRAAVGVCSVKGNIHAESQLFSAKIAAQRELPGWLARIEAASGMPIPRQAGLFEPIYDIEGYQQIRQRVFHNKLAGANRAILFDFSTIPSYLQAELPGAAGAFSFPGDYWYDPVVAVAALEEALRRQGCRFRPDLVEAFRDHPEHGLELTTQKGSVHADCLVLAAGVFTNPILARSGVVGWQQAPVEGESIFGRRRDETPGYALSFMKTSFIAHGEHVGFGSSSRPRKSIELCGLDESAATALRSVIGARVRYDFPETRWGIRGRFRHQSPVFEEIPTPSGLRRCFLLAGFHKSGLQLAHLWARWAVDKLLKSGN